MESGVCLGLKSKRSAERRRHSSCGHAPCITGLCAFTDVVLMLLSSEILVGMETGGGARLALKQQQRQDGHKVTLESEVTEASVTCRPAVTLQVKGHGFTVDKLT